MALQNRYSFRLQFQPTTKSVDSADRIKRAIQEKQPLSQHTVNSETRILWPRDFGDSRENRDPEVTLALTEVWKIKNLPDIERGYVED